MKKVLSFALVLAVLLSAFTLSFATSVSAEEVAKEFVIDGNLDVWYLSEEETPSDDYNFYHASTLEAYNKDPSNGNGMYFFDGAETSAEVFMAYDETYIYVYVKCWDDDLGIFPEETGVSAKSDSIEVWVDTDPNSQTRHPDGTAKKDSEIVGFPNNTADPLQGDVRFRLRGADFAVGDTLGIVKNNYGGATVSEWYRNTENLMPFYFDNEPREVANGNIVSSGYGMEVRIPRYDVTGGNACFINVACNNRNNGDDSEWYALAMGQAWWLDYSSAYTIIYKDSANPFFNQDITGKTVKYTQSPYNEAGMAVVEAIDQLPATVTILEKAEVTAVVDSYNALADSQKAYVQAYNYEKLKAAADKLGLELQGPAVDTPVDPPVDDPVDPPVDDPADITLGDINNDGKIDAKDALLVLRISVNKYEPTEAEQVAADVNKDENINARDALEILKYSVDKPSVLA